MIPLMSSISGSIMNPTPYSRVRKSKKLREYGNNIIGIMGLTAIVLTCIALFVINPLVDFIQWVEMFTVFVTMLLLTGLFLKYVMK